MKVDFEPASQAPLENKRNWIIYQFVRYRIFQRRAWVILMIAQMLGILSIFKYVPGWQTWVTAGVFLFFSEWVYDTVSANLLKPFYADMGEICFPKKALTPKEFVALRNIYIQAQSSTLPKTPALQVALDHLDGIYQEEARHEAEKR